MNGEERNAITDASPCGTFITSCACEVADDKFDLETDVSDVLDRNGPGVYTVQVWATLEGEPALSSAVSVFHDVEVQEGMSE